MFSQFTIIKNELFGDCQHLEMDKWRIQDVIPEARCKICGKWIKTNLFDSNVYKLN